MADEKPDTFWRDQFRMIRGGRTAAKREWRAARSRPSAINAGRSKGRRKGRRP